MKRRSAFFIALILSITACAQTVVSGRVIDGSADEPLAGASVIVKGVDNKIKKFTASDGEGRFSLSLASVVGYRIEVSMMGFEKQTVQLENASFPLTITLHPGSIRLKEVAVKADRIREQGDTISYHVGSFAQAQDRSIGDVLKRMPGIDVEQSGKIKYQGEDINKFYIEGSDLLGGKYGVATNGISHDDVGAVEVMENHQPLQVLTGLSFSDKAAINLKLKNKAKATWTFHGDAGGGWSWQPEGIVWDSEAFAMAVMPSFQSITTIRSNNTGENLSSSNFDFFADRRNTDLSTYVTLGLPSVTSLSDKRTLFNRSALFSVNNLWKMGQGEFKFNIDYSFDRTAAMSANVTTYFLEGGDRVVTEHRDGTEHNHSLNSKFIYELNQKTTFINNTLRTEFGWNDVDLRTSGSLPNFQSADLPDYYIGNNFKTIKRFKSKHLVSFHSINEWQSLPQTLRLNMTDGSLRQHISDNAFYTNESAAYSFVLKGINIGLEGGIKAYVRSMNSQLPDLPQQLPGLTENVVSTDYVTVYAMPKFEYWVRRVNLTLSLPVSYARYSFDKAIADRDEFYFSPSLSLNWKPSNRFSGTLRGNFGRAPMNLNLIHPALVMTDYRTLKAGTDDFYNSSSKSLSANFRYQHTRHGLFANAMVMHSWTSRPYTLSQKLYGDYVLYSYADAESDGRMLMSMCSLGKTLDFIHGSFNIDCSFRRSKSHLLSQSHSVNSVSTFYGVGARINATPVHWLSFDYSIKWGDSRLSMNGARQSWLSSMKNGLNLTFIPGRKWQLTVGGEYYRNELTSNNFKDILMLDSKVAFQVSKRVELAAGLTNILNKRTYNYTSYSELSSFESQRWLRGRQLLLSLTLRK